MKTPYTFSKTCAIFMMAGLFAWAAKAEKADRDKPMNVVADNMKYDDLKQTSIFNGRVVLTKGSLIIHADAMEISQDPQGFQYGTARGLGGGKATFRQKRDKPNEWIEGEAHSLIYNSKADTVEFTGSAVIRRLVGTAIADEGAGHRVRYDNRSETFTVEAASGTAGQAVPQGRVRVMLTPQSAFAPETPQPAPGAGLRNSADLEGGKR